jgi:hypothetical protein
MGQLTLTTEEVEKVNQMALDKTGLELDEVTFGVTTTPTIVTQWETSYSGKYTTADDTTGVITVGRAGVIRVRLSGSFSATAGGTYEANFYLNGVSTNIGFKRDISNVNDFDSFAGEFTSDLVPVAINDTIDLRLFVDSGTPNVTFHEMSVSTEWVD